MELVKNRDLREPRFDRRLGCYVHAVFYDFDARFGRLHMDELSSCNMPDCIELFLAIDPECRLIETFQLGSKPDTIYRLVRGEWQAFMPLPAPRPA